MLKVAEPDLDGRERDYVARAVDSGWVSGSGEFVEQFEEAVARASGKNWAVATLTGTAALHLALVASEAKGAERLPSMTFIASANALTYAGAKPYFVDIDEHWCPDWQPCGPVIDAAPAIGQSFFDERLVCFSFNGNKTITTGQGGAIVGDNKEMEAKIRHLATVAKVSDYMCDAVGFNYRMSNVNAALGCAQMERLIDLKGRKLNIMGRYRAAGLTMINSVWMAIWVTNKRDEAIEALKAERIESKPFWYPLHKQMPYNHCLRDLLPATDGIWDKLLCLPCGTKLTGHEQDKVIRVVHSLG